MRSCYDRFHENADDIYRVVENQYYAGGEVFPVAVTPSPLAPALKEQFPEVIKATRFNFRTLTIKKGEQVFSEGAAFTDPEIFDIFTIPFVQGSPETALIEPHSLVLTEEAAAKYFGKEEVLGQTLQIDNRHDFRVTGVIKNIPDNSHLQYDMLAPFIYLKELGGSMESWGSNWCYTYVRLAAKLCLSHFLGGFCFPRVGGSGDCDCADYGELAGHPRGPGESGGEFAVRMI